MNLPESFRIQDVPPDMYYIPNFITEAEEFYLLQKIQTHPWTPLKARRLQPHPTALLRGTTLPASPLPPHLSHPILPRLASLGVFAHSVHGGPNHCLVNEYLPGQGIMAHEDGPAYWPITATVSLGGSAVLEVVHKRDTVAGPGAGVPRGPVAEDYVTSGIGAMGKKSQVDVDIEEVTISETDDAEADTDLDTKNRPLPPPAQRPKQKHYRILLEPLSLLLTTSTAYTSTLHAILPTAIDSDLSAATIANWALLGDVARYQSGQAERTRRVSLTYRDVVKVSRAFGGLMGGGRR